MNECSLNAVARPKTLEEACYESLRDAITAGRLRPGERISVNRAARELNVSRLPVIHALRRLASEGFVRIHPHKNAVVAKPTPKELRVRYQMLAALERVALLAAWPLTGEKLAALESIHAEFTRRLTAGEPSDDHDRAFHELVWTAPDVEHLAATLRVLWDLGAYYRHLVNRTVDDAARRRRIEDHEAILRALQGGDPEAAVAALQAHRRNAFERLERLLEHMDGLSAPATLGGVRADAP